MSGAPQKALAAKITVHDEEGDDLHLRVPLS